MKREQHSTSGDGIARRSILQLAGTAAAVGVFGSAFGTGAARAAPATLCPRNADFWATHAWPADAHDGPSLDEVTLAGVTRTADEWRTFLLAQSDDRSHVLATQVLAAMNNLYYRPVTDFGCSDLIPGAFRGTALEGETVEDVKNTAIAWLHHSNWESSFDGAAQTDWTVTIENRTYDGATVDGEVLYEALATFNNAGFDDMDCGCDASDHVSIASVETDSPAEQRSRISETTRDRPPVGNDRIPDVI